MTFLNLIILTLAAYRLTHLIVYDKIFEPIRNVFVRRQVEFTSKGPAVLYQLQGSKIRRTIGMIMNCHWCAGIWVSAFVVLVRFKIDEFGDLPAYLCLVFAISAAISLIETAWQKSVGFPEMMEGTIKNESEAKDNEH